jgi:hypothetical protein
LRFSGLILENIFMVFLGSSCRETAKNAIKKSMGKDERKNKSQLFGPKVKSFYGVFELPLLRNAQKRHKKITHKKRGGTYLPDLSSARYTSLSFFFSSAPLGPVPVQLERKLKLKHQHFASSGKCQNVPRAAPLVPSAPSPQPPAPSPQRAQPQLATSN